MPIWPRCACSVVWPGPVDHGAVVDLKYDAIVLPHPFQGAAAVGLKDGGMGDGFRIDEVVAVIKGLGSANLSEREPPGCWRTRSARSARLHVRRRSRSWACPKFSWPQMCGVTRVVTEAILAKIPKSTVFTPHIIQKFKLNLRARGVGAS